MNPKARLSLHVTGGGNRHVNILFVAQRELVPPFSPAELPLSLLENKVYGTESEVRLLLPVGTVHV